MKEGRSQFKIFCMMLAIPLLSLTAQAEDSSFSSTMDKYRMFRVVRHGMGLLSAYFDSLRFYPTCWTHYLMTSCSLAGADY